jgi:hypothetical protein
MENSFSENFSFHRIQVDMTSQSYRIFIRILFIIIKDGNYIFLDIILNTQLLEPRLLLTIHVSGGL